MNHNNNEAQMTIQQVIEKFESVEPLHKRFERLGEEDRSLDSQIKEKLVQTLRNTKKHLG